MKKSRSFGLIEVLVTAVIFVIFAGSLISLSSVGSRNIIVNKHRLQAANLAQEGIELVKQIRDTAWLNGVDWIEMSNVCWGLEASTAKKRLIYNNPGGVCSFYHYYLESGAQTFTIDNVQYTRTINIEDLDLDGNPGDDTKKITVSVSWSDFGQDKNITMATYLTNWRMK